MDKYAHIVSLVDKLLKGNLSQQELSELQHLFRPEEAEGNVELWLNDLWNSSEYPKDSSIDTAYMLRKLDEKIRFSKQGFPVVKEKREIRFARLIHPFMRYAAVFLLAISFSWFWFGRGKVSEKHAIKESETIISLGVSEISVMYGSKTRIVLPDSSVVFLNSGSMLSYTSTFESERYVTLTGEGYFIVRSDSLRPFWVHTKDVSVKATGTEFNVKAYPEEESIETTLISGVVEIFKKGQTKPIIELASGEKAAYVKETLSTTVSAPANIAKEQIIVGPDKKPDVTTGWVNNQLVFDAEPFEQIAVRLERWFNVEIDIRNENLSRTRMSGRYDAENIQQVMRSLQLATPFNYQIDKNKIIIR